MGSDSIGQKVLAVSDLHQRFHPSRVLICKGLASSSPDVHGDHVLSESATPSKGQPLQLGIRLTGKSSSCQTIKNLDESKRISIRVKGNAVQAS